MNDVSRAINKNTLSEFPCLYSRPVLDNTVPYLEIPVYRQWYQGVVSAQPQSLTAELQEELTRTGGSFEFYFKTGEIASGIAITSPKASDCFFIQNVGWFFITAVSPWATQGAGYTQVTASYRSTHIITNAGGDTSLIPGYGGSTDTVPLPYYKNPYTTDEIADRIFRAHYEAFSLIYGTTRTFWAADQDCSRFPCYAVLRFITQNQSMHPLVYDEATDDDTVLKEVAESNYEIKVMLSFQGGTALLDRDRWETLIFHEKVSDIFSDYGIGLSDDFYSENITDSDQGRRLQKARTSYTVNIIRTESINVDAVTNTSLESLSVNKVS